MHLRQHPERAQGQILVLWALMLSLFILVTALVIDGGYAFAQRRTAQNAADLSALAAVKQMATSGATDTQVKNVITSTAAANRSTVLFGAANNGPQYYDKTGATALGYVGDGTIPANAVAVSVPASVTFTPFLARFIGVTNWKASAAATARGTSNVAPALGPIFPVGISSASFDQSQAGHMVLCPANKAAGTGAGQCPPQTFTDGSNNVPGGKSWLKFGCPGYGLGQGSNGGCDNSKPFLQDEIGPPANSYGCCTAVGLAGSADLIGSVPGNKASADCSYYIDNHIIVTVPVWDTDGGNGSGGYYHIVGFAGFELTNCNGGKDIEGVWRTGIFTSPTASPPPPPGVPLSIQLLK